MHTRARYCMRPIGRDTQGQAKRDRTILSTLLYRGIRRELGKTESEGQQPDALGVAHLRIRGKGGKTRFVPIHLGTLTLIEEYLEAVGMDRMRMRPYSGL
jgi:site-specific recombinase XerD